MGAKTDWFERRLRLNLSAFKYDYSNLQVQALLQPGLATITNAATAGGAPGPPRTFGVRLSRNW